MKKSRPSTTSSVPQNSSPRRILASFRTTTAQQASANHVNTEQDEQPRRPIGTEETQALEDRGEDQEQDRGDDQEIEAAAEVLTSILTQEAGDQYADRDEAGDQRPQE